MFHHVETVIHFLRKKVGPKWIIQFIIFYLAAKHSNMFLAMQISKLIGFSVYITQLWEVSKRNFVFDEIITMYFTPFFTLDTSLSTFVFTMQTNKICLTPVIN